MRPSTLAEPVTPAFLALRQQHRDVDVRATVRAALGAGEDAGLAVRQSERDQVRLFVTRSAAGDARRVVAVHRRAGVDSSVGEVSLAAGDGPVTLTVSARGQDYALLAADGDETPVTVAVVDGRTLDSVATGGFLGLWVGVFATSNGRPSATMVQVEQLEYVPVL